MCSVHSATDSCLGWDYYGRIVGARFDGHPWTTEFSVEVTDADHPATRILPEDWSWRDEVYLFRDLREDARVLLQVAPGQLDMEVEGARIPPCGLPLAWCHVEGEGRVFSTWLGHFPSAWESPLFLAFLAGGLEWVLEKSVPKSLPPSKVLGLGVAHSDYDLDLDCAAAWKRATPMAERVCLPASPKIS